MFKGVYILMAGAIGLAVSTAHASTSSVSGISVDKGEVNAQFRNSIVHDNEDSSHEGRWRTRLGADYGFTDAYAAGLFIQTDKLRGEDLEFDSLLFDQRLELANEKDDGFYTGFRLRYTYRDEAADDVHLRFILGAPVGNWDFRINQLAIQEIGAESRDATIFETRTHVSYPMSDTHRIGFESFHNFGDAQSQDQFDMQTHSVGPIIEGQLDEHLRYDAAYRMGVSDAANDHSVRFILYRSF